MSSGRLVPAIVLWVDFQLTNYFEIPVGAKLVTPAVMWYTAAAEGFYPLSILPL